MKTMKNNIRKKIRKYTRKLNNKKFKYSKQLLKGGANPKVRSKSIKGTVQSVLCSLYPLPTSRDATHFPPRPPFVIAEVCFLSSKVTK